jgi:two-component system, OmpR family, sensor histidine kinase KdpD
MGRGNLRIYLGAAPGAGKTFAMLEEGQRLRAQGVDVVLGAPPLDGRTETLELLGGLELCPPPSDGSSGDQALDLKALLDRAPELVLVDDYAATNGKGHRNDKRWKDVDELLDAGIDVISTLDIRNVASLSDVVQEITGVRPTEAVPDTVLRRIDQVELIDAAPELLRERLAEGKIYGPREADAALAGEFRMESLTALRELALLWLAERVESGLADFREARQIQDSRPAREKIVVGLSGNPGGQALVRRAARMLAGTAGGELHAVHVRRTAHGNTNLSPKELDLQRKLVTDVGGTFHAVGGDDVAGTLLGFARSLNASQIVLGTARHWSGRHLARGVGSRILRDAGSIDVHLVPQDAAPGDKTARSPSRLGRNRRVLAFVLALCLAPALQLALTQLPHRQLSTDMLVHLSGIIAVAMVGGLFPAVLAALLSGLIVNYFTVRPVGTLHVLDPENVLALVIFILVAVAVSLVVDVSARRAKEARVAGAEAAILAELSRRAVAEGNSVHGFLEQVCEHFQATGAGLWARRRTGSGNPAWDLREYAGSAQPSVPEESDSLEQLDEDRMLTLTGRELTQDERRLFSAFGAHLLAMLQREELTASQRENVRLSEGNKMRTSILRAVSHDLRTPLAGIKLAASSLREPNVVFSPDEQQELLATIESGADKLDGLVSNLLDMSRITADSVAPLIRPVYWADIVAEALRGSAAERVMVVLPDNMPPIDADPGMLERVVANLVENALKYAPESTVMVAGAVGGSGSATIGRIPASELRIVDHGPGIPAEDVVAMFRPFQRADDTRPVSGIGLGLAVARGFTEAMGGRLLAEPTPGGGLTMVIRLPLSTGVTPYASVEEYDAGSPDRR